MLMPLGFELLNEIVQLVSVDGDVLHTILLFTGLALKEGRHIQRESMQVQAIAISASLPDDLGRLASRHKTVPFFLDHGSLDGHD